MPLIQFHKIIRTLKEEKKKKTGNNYIANLYIDQISVHHVDFQKEYYGDQVFPAWSFYIHIDFNGVILHQQYSDDETMGQKKEDELKLFGKSHYSFYDFEQEEKILAAVPVLIRTAEIEKLTIQNRKFTRCGIYGFITK